ncbi:hypothetical protein PT974_11755 [Cladobotryum mycophilum]|uniref:Uncharacterized protein n=1 Tax=Cladobotryum mycophilum TaxID=491253 RepID=A0ABR0S629_9HYPO
MAQTIFDVLVEPNPELDSSFITGGSNTFNHHWIKVARWLPWKDFTYDNLTSIYQQLLSTPWENPPSIPTASKYDSEIRDEHSLDPFLARFLFPTINKAFEHVTKTLSLDNDVLYLGPGTWTGQADWSVVSRQQMIDGRYICLLPGDTKLSEKWQSKMEKSRSKYDRRQWSLPVSQLNTYAAYSSCRYGFLITDQHLVVLRISKEPVDPGLALNRSPRPVAQTAHQSIAPDDIDLSFTMEDASPKSLGAQSFTDNNPVSTEYLPPEYAVVSWNAHGKGQLLVKLAIFCLSLLAARGIRILLRAIHPSTAGERKGHIPFVMLQVSGSCSLPTAHCL